MKVNDVTGVTAGIQPEGAEASFRTAIALQAAHARRTPAATPAPMKTGELKPGRFLRCTEDLESRFMEDIGVISLQYLACQACFSRCRSGFACREADEST